MDVFVFCLNYTQGQGLKLRCVKLSSPYVCL